MGLFDAPAKLLFGQADPNIIANVPRPEDIKYAGLTDESGKLQSQYSMRQQPRGAFEQRLRAQALAEGPTAAAMQQAGRAGQLAQTGYAQGLSNMAQAGGVSAGSRERLAKQASLQGMLGRQRAFAEGEAQKLGMQQGFAQQEAGERGADVQAQIANRQGQNQFNIDKYRQQLAEYAGAQQGRAQIQLANQQQGSQLFGSLLGAGATLGGGYLAGR